MLHPHSIRFTVGCLLCKQMADSTEEAADAMMDSLREALQNPLAAAAFGNEPLAISIASSSRGSLQPLVQGSAAWQGRQAVLAATAPAEALPPHPALMLPTQTLVKVTLHGSALCCFFLTWEPAALVDHKFDCFAWSLQPLEGMGELAAPSPNTHISKG